MKKIKIELEFSDDFEPCTYGCVDECPFGYYDGEANEYMCDSKNYINGDYECLVSIAAGTELNKEMN